MNEDSFEMRLVEIGMVELIVETSLPFMRLQLLVKIMTSENPVNLKEYGKIA